MLMAGNYNNIDLANKMECISTREYLLSVSKMIVHHLLEKTFIPLGAEEECLQDTALGPSAIKKRNSHRQALD